MVCQRGTTKRAGEEPSTPDFMIYSINVEFHSSPVHFSSLLYRYTYVERLAFAHRDNPKMSWANDWLCVLTPSSLPYFSSVGCNRKSIIACNMTDIRFACVLFCGVLVVFVCGWLDFVAVWFFFIAVGLVLIWFGMVFLFCLICLRPCKKSNFCCLA